MTTVKSHETNGKRSWSFELNGTVVCRVHGLSLAGAIDAAAAARPDLAEGLDALRCDDLCGEPAQERAERPSRTKSAAGMARRKRGSGARFRQLILAGRTNAEALAVVRAEFLESKATLSDAAWNRARLREGEWNADGTKKGPGAGAPGLVAVGNLL